MRARRVLPVLFFVSGAVGLGCETAWSRALALLFGASQRSTGVLLGAFMTGLALGGELGARLADRLRRPALGYALAELVVGAYALVARPLFDAAEGAALSWPPAARVPLAFALLAAPTCAMGASLPFLAAAVVPTRDRLRRGLAGLYGVNVAGGVAGALLAGFVLLPRVGLAATLSLCGVVALAVAAVAAATATATAAAPSPATERGDRLAVVLAAVVGLLSFALQVTWNRVFALLSGSSAYTFTTVVSVILAGLAAGGLRERARAELTWSAISGRLVALAIFVYLGTLAVGVAPFYLASAAARGGAAAARLVLVILVVGAPSYLVGGLFPALAARFPARQVGRAAGHALVATTVGNLAGALGAAFLFVPLLGAQRTLGAAAAVALALAVAAAARAGRERLIGTAAAALLAVAGAALLRPAWDRVGLSAGSYRAALYRALDARRDDAPCGPRRRFPETRVLYYREGELATVAVLGHPGGADCSLYSLRVNGKAEGSVFVAAPLAPRLPAGAPRLDVGDYPTEVLAGALPAVAGPPPAEALVVGWGTGISVRALLDAGAAHAVAVEIEPAVIQAARVFDATLAEDPRVTVVADDARVVLARLAPGSLDAIVSQPSNPWVVGAASLFSREYFQLLRSRLRPGGRALVWAQLYEIDRESLRSLVATFVAVFPAARAFRPPGSADLLLLGAAADAPPALRRPIVPLADGPALARWSAGAPLTTDDNGLIEYRVADRLLVGDETPIADLLRGLGAP